MAGHTPKIGRNFIKQAIDLSPAEETARVAAGVALTEPLTENEIAAREKVKADLLRSITPPEPEPPAVSVLAGALASTSGLARLVALDQAARDGQRDIVDEAVAEAEALLAPHRDAGKDAIARFAKLKDQVAQRVRGVAMLNRAYEVDVHAGRAGIGLIIAGMAHQGWDVQTDRLRGTRLAADVLPVGTAHSVVAGSHGRSGGRQIEDAFRMLADRYDSMVQDGRREFYG